MFGESVLVAMPTNAAGAVDSPGFDGEVCATTDATGAVPTASRLRTKIVTNRMTDNLAFIRVLHNLISAHRTGSNGHCLTTHT